MSFEEIIIKYFKQKYNIEITIEQAKKIIEKYLLTEKNYESIFDKIQDSNIILNSINESVSSEPVSTYYGSHSGGSQSNTGSSSKNTDSSSASVIEQSNQTTNNSSETTKDDNQTNNQQLVNENIETATELEDNIPKSIEQIESSSASAIEQSNQINEKQLLNEKISTSAELEDNIPESIEQIETSSQADFDVSPENLFFTISGLKTLFNGTLESITSKVSQIDKSLYTNIGSLESSISNFGSYISSGAELQNKLISKADQLCALDTSFANAFVELTNKYINIEELSTEETEAEDTREWSIYDIFKISSNNESENLGYSYIKSANIDSSKPLYRMVFYKGQSDDYFSATHEGRGYLGPIFKGALKIGEKDNLEFIGAQQWNTRIDGLRIDNPSSQNTVNAFAGHSAGQYNATNAAYEYVINNKTISPSFVLNLDGTAGYDSYKSKEALGQKITTLNSHGVPYIKVTNCATNGHQAYDETVSIQKGTASIIEINTTGDITHGTVTEAFNSGGSTEVLLTGKGNAQAENFAMSVDILTSDSEGNIKRSYYKGKDWRINYYPVDREGNRLSSNTYPKYSDLSNIDGANNHILTNQEYTECLKTINDYTTGKISEAEFLSNFY